MIERLRLQVQRYIEDRGEDAALNVGADMRKINFCFRQLKEAYLKSFAAASSKAVIPAAPSSLAALTLDASHYDNKETKTLKDTLKQRDNEISKREGTLGESVYF